VFLTDLLKKLLHQQKMQSKSKVEEAKVYFAIFTFVLFQRYFYVSRLGSSLICNYF